MTRLRSESGQVIPFVGVVLLATLLGVCALAIDMGVWYKTSRHAQGVADAAALAAVQDLPGDPAAAQADAVAYAQANGGTVDGAPAVTTTDAPDDTISVRAVEQAPAFFARVFGIDSATVHAIASAQVSAASIIKQEDESADGTGRPLPLVISVDSAPSPGCNCLDEPVTLTYGPSAAIAGGEFGLLDFANANGGTPPQTVGDWIANGYPGDLGPGDYQGVTGNKTVPPAVDGAMQELAAIHPTVVLPVYSGTNGASGGQTIYTIVGWAAFKIDSWDASGSTTTLRGSFQTLHTESTGPTTKYFGVGSVRLTK
jgi:hypothetical protein